MKPTGRFYPSLRRSRRNQRVWQVVFLAGAALAFWVTFIAMIMLAMIGAAMGWR